MLFQPCKDNDRALQEGLDKLFAKQKLTDLVGTVTTCDNAKGRIDNKWYGCSSTKYGIRDIVQKHCPEACHVAKVECCHVQTPGKKCCPNGAADIPEDTMSVISYDSCHRHFMFPNKCSELNHQAATKLNTPFKRMGYQLCPVSCKCKTTTPPGNKDGQCLPHGHSLAKSTDRRRVKLTNYKVGWGRM